MICPECGAELEGDKETWYDMHTHFCHECNMGLILNNDKWISVKEWETIEEAKKETKDGTKSTETS
jgi:inorganic pyrophosphatase